MKAFLKRVFSKESAFLLCKKFLSRRGGKRGAVVKETLSIRQISYLFPIHKRSVL